jgi:prepilin-type processing-associated H-X9-DG protein
MKQLGMASALFQSDNHGRFSPAAVTGTGLNIAWDGLMHRYLGDYGTPDTIYANNFPEPENAPKVLVCPADRAPKVNWMYYGNQISHGLGFGARTYNMNGCGVGWQLGYMTPLTGGKWVLPPATHGVGVFWYDSSITTVPPGTLCGYPDSVMQDPAGTMEFAETANGQNRCNETWLSCCVGPISPAANGSTDTTIQQFQLCGGASYATQPVQDPASGTAYNNGYPLYVAHGKRFNYTLHDGHVQALKIEQTIGRGGMGVAGIPKVGGGFYPSTAPLGMWTMTPGD